MISSVRALARSRLFSHIDWIVLAAVVSISLLGLVFIYVRDGFRSQEQLRAENTLLRHQLNVLRRKISGSVQLRGSDRALFVWTRLLRHQVRSAGMTAADHCFGLAWSGHMTRERVRLLLAHLPDGVSEIYFHPAVERDPDLVRLMPDYEHEAELAVLLDRGLLGPGA